MIVKDWSFGAVDNTSIDTGLKHMDSSVMDARGEVDSDQ